MKNAYAMLPVYGLLLYCICFAPACRKPGGGSEDIIGNWTTAADFRGDSRSEAVAFVLDNMAYVLTGTSDKGPYNDMYGFDITNGNWTKKTSLPGDNRIGAVAFAINGKGYIGKGYNSDIDLQDFWEYDPGTQTWTNKDDFPGGARHDAAAFVINGKAYICGGYDGKAFNDCWEFNPAKPAGQQWEEKASFPHKTRAGVAFVLNSKGYLVTGSNNGEIQKELYQYDPGLNQWSTKRKLFNFSNESYDDKYTSIVRQNAVAFVLGNYAYITSGENGSFVASTWQYDADADTWKEKTGFEAKARQGSIAFTVNNRAFVLTGNNGTLYMDNTFEFHPDAEKVEGD